MADIESKNKNLPLIIGGVVVGVIVLYMVMTSKKRASAAAAAAAERARLLAAGGAPRDPCLKPDGTRIPDWACGTVALLNPLAQAGTSIYQSKVNLDLQKEQLKQQQIARGY